MHRYDHVGGTLHGYIVVSTPHRKSSSSQGHATSSPWSDPPSESNSSECPSSQGTPRPPWLACLEQAPPTAYLVPAPLQRISIRLSLSAQAAIPLTRRRARTHLPQILRHLLWIHCHLEWLEARDYRRRLSPLPNLERHVHRLQRALLPRHALAVRVLDFVPRLHLLD